MCGGRLSIARTKAFLPDGPARHEGRDPLNYSGPASPDATDASGKAPTPMLAQAGLAQQPSQRQAQPPSWQAAAAKLAAADHTQSWALLPPTDSSGTSSCSDAPPYCGQWSGAASTQFPPATPAATMVQPAPCWPDLVHQAYDAPALRGNQGRQAASIATAPQPRINSSMECAMDRLLDDGAAGLWQPYRQHHVPGARQATTGRVQAAAPTAAFASGKGHQLPQPAAGDHTRQQHVQYTQYMQGKTPSSTITGAAAYAPRYAAADRLDQHQPAAGGRAFYDGGGYEVQGDISKAQAREARACLLHQMTVVPNEGCGLRGADGTSPAWHVAPGCVGMGVLGSRGHVDAAMAALGAGSVGAACEHGGQGVHGSLTEASSPSSPSTGSARSTYFGGALECAAAVVHNDVRCNGGSGDLAAQVADLGDLGDLLLDECGEVLDGWVPPAGCDPDAIKLFVGHIPKAMTEAQLRMQLELVGKVVELQMKRSRFNHIAFCWYASRESGERALLHFKAMRHVMRGLSERGSAGATSLVVRRAKVQAPRGAGAHGAAAKPGAPAGGKDAAASGYLQCMQQLLLGPSRSLDGEQLQANKDGRQLYALLHGAGKPGSQVGDPYLSGGGAAVQEMLGYNAKGLLRRGLSELPGSQGSTACSSGSGLQGSGMWQGPACGSAVAAATQAADEADLELLLPLSPQGLATLSSHVQQMVATMSGARITWQPLPEPGEHCGQLVVRGTPKKVEAARSMISGMVGM